MKHGRMPLGVLLVFLVLLLNLLAASPSLHELIHHDADEPGHQCAVTMFAHGQVDSATVDVPIVVTSIPFEPFPQHTFSAFAPAIENLPAGRAPPVLPAVS
jgi:hypothetical protein